jgi:predicted dehydrogenase
MPGARVVALADPDARAVENVRALAPGAIVATPDQLIALPHVDAVLIANPTALHASSVCQVAGARKALYVEKPIAMSRAEAAAVVDAVHRSGIVAAVGFNRRLHPAIVAAKAALARGRIGRVVAVHTVFAEPIDPAQMPVWKRARATGGGVLLDLASHHIDLLRWLLDDEVTQVCARIASIGTEDDEARLALEFAGGSLAQCFFSFRASRADTVELHGERGTLRLDRHRQSVTLATHRRFGYGTRARSLAWGAAASGWLHPGRDPSYRGALAAFVRRASRSEPVTPLASVLDGARSLAVVLAAERAAERHAAVMVDGA